MSVKFQKACIKDKNERFKELISQAHVDIIKMYLSEPVLGWFKEFADKCVINFKDRVGTLEGAKDVLNRMILDAKDPKKKNFLSALNGIVKQEIFYEKARLEKAESSAVGSTAVMGQRMSSSSVSIPIKNIPKNEDKPRAKSAPPNLQANLIQANLIEELKKSQQEKLERQKNIREEENKEKNETKETDKNSGLGRKF